MSATPNTAGKDELNESRSTGAPKAANPARPSKFAGLNLRQRASEPLSEPPNDQRTAEAEPTQPLQAPAREREQATTATESRAAQAQEGLSAAPNPPAAPSASSRPMTGAIETSASPARGVAHAPTDTAGKEQPPTRHRGKRTNPDYVQVTAYVRQETYRRARIKLLESTKPQEFSEVVEDLLTRWLRSGS